MSCWAHRAPEDEVVREVMRCLAQNGKWDAIPGFSKKSLRWVPTCRSCDEHCAELCRRIRRGIGWKLASPEPVSDIGAEMRWVHEGPNGTKQKEVFK